MKHVSIVMMILVILFGSLIVSACGVMEAQHAEALALSSATSTPLPLPTRTPVNTPSPVPTRTPVPATSTPSRMDLPVENEGLQIEVLEIEKPYQIHLSETSIFVPGKGHMFLGLGIKVTNLTNEDIPFKWNEIYLTNKYQDRWYPLWGAYKKTNMVIDPLGIEIRQFKVDHKNQPEARIYLGDNGYMRVIFRVPRDNYYYYLGFADLPWIEIVNEDS